MKPPAAIIIPTYTNTVGLKHVLDCLIRCEMDYPVVIVNNGAHKLSGVLPQKKLTITVIEQGKNTGFAPACNAGVAETKRLFDPEYVAFVNDDISFDTDWIEDCISAAKRKKWQACAPVLLRPEGTVENVGYQVLPIGRAVLITDPSDEREKSGLTAAALVFETEAFVSLGGFDERLFAYLEDVELFLHAKKMGMKWGVEYSVAVVHEGQVTSNRFPVKKAWLDLRNWTYLITKHWGVRAILTYGPQLLLERLRNVAGLLKAIFQ